MQVKDRAVCAQKELFMGKVTNKDIAERAGVSAAAVSLAIHGRKGISEATRANILRIVQEMNYAPPSRSCTDSRAVVLIPGAGLRMPPPALLQGIADFAAQQRAQLHILTLQQLMEDFPAKLTGCMLLVTFDELDRSKLDLIASASPDILVLDEPAAGLDPEGRDTILSQIRNYHEQTGITVILVSHSMEDIARYANRVLVMSKAKVAMYDTVEKVFARAPELLELGLSVPQVTQVFLMLKAMGMEIDTDVYTVPYAVKTVLKAWNAKHPDKAVPLPQNHKTVQEGGAD